MKGIVASGRGEGKKYVGIEGYKRHFLKMGIAPYPGTLNIIVGDRMVRDLKEMGGIRIEGFYEKGKKYGRVECFPVNIFGENALLVLPEKSRYKDIVEIVAERNLRERYGIRDGDEVILFFNPFVKKCREMKLFATPYIGKRISKITVFYDDPFTNGRRDLCYFTEKENEREYRKTVAGREIACIPFYRNLKTSYATLMKFINERGYHIMYPPRIVKYSCLSEWQIEIKSTPH